MFSSSFSKHIGLIFVLLGAIGSLSAQDTLPPVCTITAPSQAEIVSGVILLTADATDDVGIDNVQFLVNFGIHGIADTEFPYVAVWDTFLQPPGIVSISAIATDTSGNQSIAPTIFVTVDNTTGSSQDCSIRFSENLAGNDDYGRLDILPAGFGAGEFTLEMWVRPQSLYAVGDTSSGEAQRLMWSDADPVPYSSANWWQRGNVLLDGRNFASPKDGGIALQMYGGGRLRWLIGDGSTSPTGGMWAIGAHPATDTSSLLDGKWHSIALVRRWVAPSSAKFELWIDGELVDTESTPLRTDMTSWWNGWIGFPAGEGGWFIGVHKRAALNIIAQHEDYKGLFDLLRFWNRAKEPIELRYGHRHDVIGTEPDLSAHYPLDECAGTVVSDVLSSGGDISLFQMPTGYWSVYSAPATPVADLKPQVLTEWQPDGSLRLIMLGAPGRQHDLVHSADLSGWTPITSLTFERSVYDWIDAAAASGSGTFYRLDQHGQ